MTKILAINGSYRDDGITDQTVEVMFEALKAAGAELELIILRDIHIEFCLNCRECTQQPGDTPAECVQHDAMQDWSTRLKRLMDISWHRPLILVQ